jgi:hypothetical protein
MPNCCDEYGNCNQGRDCPIRVATYRPVMRAADPLPPSIWRDQLKRLGYWVMMAILGLTIWPLLAYAVLS